MQKQRKGGGQSPTTTKAPKRNYSAQSAADRANAALEKLDQALTSAPTVEYICCCGDPDCGAGPFTIARIKE